MSSKLLSQDEESIFGSRRTKSPRRSLPRVLFRRLSRTPPRRLLNLAAAVVTLTLLIFLTILAGRKYARRPRSELLFPPTEHSDSGDRRFVIVIPINNPNPELCKVVSSTIALGYPAPIITNWNKTFNDPHVKFGGSHIAKIGGALEYLDAASSPDANTGDRLREDDLVLMVDAYDVWFQLPPEVLLRRYHETNQRANARLAYEWGGSGDVPWKQTIVTSGQKRCFPDNGRPAELHCDAVPESPMREDLYGDNTDDPWDSTYHQMRPRYVNSGTIMGPVGDMRRLLRRISEKVEREKNLGWTVYSDQGLLGEVFGEQSVWRNLRQQWNEEPAGVPEEAIVMMQDAWEYHIGIDYRQGLYVSTFYEEYDGRIINLNDTDTIKRASDSLGISPARVDGVPEDLEGVPNPLQRLYEEDSPEVDLDWGHMPLYADFYTTAVPAILHHNGVKKRRTAWWDKPWFFPHLRDLVTMQIQPGELECLGHVPTSAGELTYWPPSSNTKKRKARLFTHEGMVGDGLEEMEFNDVCMYRGETEDSDKHWYDEVFRDGKGPL